MRKSKKVKFTPGPWRTEILSDAYHHPVRVTDEAGIDIAVLAFGGVIDRRTAEANAKFIAQTPNLLLDAQALCVAMATGNRGLLDECYHRLMATIGEIVGGAP